MYARTGQSFLDPTTFSLYFLALTRLATAFVVFFGIQEISGRSATGRSAPRACSASSSTAGRTSARPRWYAAWCSASSPRSAAGGMVVGSAQFYAQSLGGGESTFYVLFAMIFVGPGHRHRGRARG